MTITEFIEARIAELEGEAERARSAAAGPGGDGMLWVVTGADNAVGVDYDPTRELRQCDALRAVMSFYTSLVSASQQIEFENEVTAPLAAIWSDHPDYQQEWKS